RRRGTVRSAPCGRNAARDRTAGRGTHGGAVVGRYLAGIRIAGPQRDGNSDRNSHFDGVTFHDVFLARGNADAYGHLKRHADDD
ncbi:hypothetical protein QK292_19545, partial [Arthrobacter sp. AL08]|uniref:hypothetical protein n=1 Tax=Arthrobacter sp. AL08 TaxID=3042234 RepID=UPI00249CDEA8